MININYEINVTYRCNASCRYCTRLTDLLPWKGNTDLPIEDLDVAAAILRGKGIKTTKIRISGGETLLHPDIVGICKAVKMYWKPTLVFFYTNGLSKVPKWLLKEYEEEYFRLHSISGGRRLEWRSADHPYKHRHNPTMISPADLGMEPVSGFNRMLCRYAGVCGRCFDTFGFSSCSMAVTIGPLMGKDVHSGRPVLDGDEEVCRHCIESLGKVDRLQIHEEVRQGKIKYPSKTYRKWIKRGRQLPKRFSEREED